jgi:ethanolamine utilization protein EutQ (cupin superfamily)
VAQQTTVKRLTEGAPPYSELVPGLELSRAITHAGTTQLGGGYMRFAADAEFPDWTLTYDEVLFVQKGELEVASDGGSVKAHPGEAILIPKGSKVTYRGRAGTLGFFVLWPFDWDKKNEESREAHRT